MTSTIRLLCTLPAVLALAALTGCASQITHQEITPAPMQLAKHHAQSVSVIALPLLASVPMASAAPMVELRTALTDAITASQSFADVKSGGADYQLTVQVFSNKYSTSGLSCTTEVEMGWTLKRTDTGAVAWQEALKTEHTTSPSDAFVGVERAKMSLVGAIKKNISAGLSHIASLSL